MFNVTGENIGNKDSNATTELTFNQDYIDKCKEEYDNIFGEVNINGTKSSEEDKY